MVSGPSAKGCLGEKVVAPARKADAVQEFQDSLELFENM
jgi:hypothetical protein